MKSLAGYFLIATPQMPDPRFAEKVIYMCSHESDEGAMGLIVNNPIPDVTLASVFESLEIPVPDMHLPAVFMGGPVEIEAAFFLHSADYTPREYLGITERIRLSRDPRILSDIAKRQGPEDYLFILGYSGWGPGQLEHELTHDGWLTLPSEYDDLFHTPPEKMWKKITSKHGIDISLFGHITGMA